MTAARTVAIHQPQYWPWPRYLHKAMSSDVFVYLDTVQFSKNGLQNRNQIKTAAGASWLTLPVKQHLSQTIRETRIADIRALDRHAKTVTANYGRAAGYRRWTNEVEGFFDLETDSLCDVAIASTEWMLGKLDAPGTRVRASELDGLAGESSALIASICQAVNADAYLTGTGSLDYLDVELLERAGCRTFVQQWQTFSYPQLFPDVGFVADLTALDLLLNCPDDARGMIRAAGSWTPLAARVHG
jgi:hypothetical protein